MRPTRHKHTDLPCFSLQKRSKASKGGRRRTYFPDTSTAYGTGTGQPGGSPTGAPAAPAACEGLRHRARREWAPRARGDRGRRRLREPQGAVPRFQGTRQFLEELCREPGDFTCLIGGSPVTWAYLLI